ncbi:MAG: alanine--tRNA ligase [Oscillospiraceae bacterium]|jgi:alanyl-tRNA synthetase|nr:alanine--tRNA ligase [Oscillospiraceae bacterium]
MEWTGLNELREKYLAFFESKGHLRLPSYSLVPENDNSLLLINSGMAPMKKYFTGEITPPSKRVTTCQKCIRTPDIERVGITARHGTYFEMLGNFSFGDYFKEQATAWAWEFCLDVMQMDKDLLWVSIYENDDEAFDIWVNKNGVSPSHIVRLGKEDNFWEHGAGPCGPCSEIYYDRGEQYGCGSPDCAVGCDCDRYVEFWNNVFTQFESDGKGNYTPLEFPNIDTGMGLERLACISQGVENLFLVDTVQNIMKHVCSIAGIEYGKDEKKDISLRVITDHIRSTTFMIGDGVVPENTGKGYVLRRLLRRAARHGRLLGIKRTFLTEVCRTVINENLSAYPELSEKKDFILKVIANEEESFAQTIDKGIQLLDSFISKNDGGILSGEDAFKLQDTYGFPIDLTVEILADQGRSVDTEAFRKIYDDYRADTRSKRKNAGAEAWEGEADVLADLKPTKFVGYTKDSAKAKIAAIVSGGKRISSAKSGEEVLIVLNTTPFYAESGGQIGDTGVIESGGAAVRVLDTTKNHAGIFLHRAVVESGEISVGASVTASIDRERRMSIRRNHTAAHLLQAALRKVLGNHVEQAGSMVSDKILRFDFVHFSALTAEEIRAVEDLVNKEIFAAIKVLNKEMPIDEAKKLGAMALFGEKYGDMVRVVQVADFSLELCGGTHIDDTAKMGMFKIKSESSVASGVRRIEGVTGENVLDMLNDSLSSIEQVCAVLKVGNSADLLRRSTQLISDSREKDRQIEQLSSKLAAVEAGNILSGAKEIGSGVSLICKRLSNVSADDLRMMGDKIRDKDSSAIAVFASVSGEKATLFTSVGKAALAKGAHAGNIVKAVAMLAGGNGGGKPEAAMAGVKDLSKLDYALSQAEEIVKGMLK